MTQTNTNTTASKLLTPNEWLSRAAEGFSREVRRLREQHLARRERVVQTFVEAFATLLAAEADPWESEEPATALQATGLSWVSGSASGPYLEFDSASLPFGYFSREDAEALSAALSSWNPVVALATEEATEATYFVVRVYRPSEAT